MSKPVSSSKRAPISSKVATSKAKGTRAVGNAKRRPLRPGRGLPLAFVEDEREPVLIDARTRRFNGPIDKYLRSLDKQKQEQFDRTRWDFATQGHWEPVPLMHARPLWLCPAVATPFASREVSNRVIVRVGKLTDKAAREAIDRYVEQEESMPKKDRMAHLREWVARRGAKDMADDLARDLREQCEPLVVISYLVDPDGTDRVLATLGISLHEAYQEDYKTRLDPYEEAMWHSVHWAIFQYACHRLTKQLAMRFKVVQRLPQKSETGVIFVSS